VRPAVAAPGDSTRHDWAIATEFAQRLEAQLRPGQPTLFPYPLNDAGAEAVWNEHRESTRGRDLDITGMSYALLDAAPQQWPLREGDTPARPRLYEDGVFPTARRPRPLCQRGLPTRGRAARCALPLQPDHGPPA
jgi:assimilatory nitrate reductase catalytic subunit